MSDKQLIIGHSNMLAARGLTPQNCCSSLALAFCLLRSNSFLFRLLLNLLIFVDISNTALTRRL